jgi:hypothetical protein
MLNKGNINYYFLFILYFTTFSGAFRKWGLDNGAVNFITLAIQLLVPIGLLFYKENLKSKEKTRVSFSLFSIYLFIITLLAFNPLNLTIYHGLLGIIVHSIFWSMIFVYLYNSDDIDLTFLVKHIIVLGLIQVVIGTIQYASPGDAFINKYAQNTEELSSIAKVGDAVRATGTFSYLSGFNAFFYLYLFANCYLLKKTPKNMWVLVTTFLGLYGMLISGSRGGLLFYVVVLISFLIFESNIVNQLRRISASIVFLLLILAINIGLNDPLNLDKKFTLSYTNFSERVESNEGENSERVTKDVSAVLFSKFDYRYLGIGLGATYQGAKGVFGVSPLLNTVAHEGELFRLIIEGGYILLLFKFVLLSYVFSKIKLSVFFKIILFIIIGFFSSLAFNVYSSIYLALSLILLDKLNSTQHDTEFKE